MEGCFLAGGRSAEDCVGSWERMLGIFVASYGSVVRCVEFCVYRIECKELSVELQNKKLKC